MHPLLIAEYKEALAGASLRTADAYLRVLRQFSTWWEDTLGLTFDPDQVATADVREYLAHLRQTGRAVATRNRALVVLKSFFRWAAENGHVRRDVARPLNQETAGVRATRQLTPRQRLLLKRAVDLDGSARTAALFALGYWAGLRVGEVSNLLVRHCRISERKGELTIEASKGGKTRVISLKNEARAPLYRYLHEALERNPGSPYVFSSQRHQRFTERGIHYWFRGLVDSIKGSARDADELKELVSLTYHDLRHDFCHRCIEAGWSLTDVATYVGHFRRDGTANIASTARYTVPTAARLEELLEQTGG